jgi:small conductance mechanosensitive channel
VHEVGLFVTTIDTLDNIRTYVGNSKVFSGNIQNFTANPYRRVDLKAQLNHEVDHNEAIRLLKERLAQIPHVMTDPAPDVEILEFNLAGPVLAVRPYVHSNNYWQVYFDTNRAIRKTFGEAHFPAPEHHLVVRST